MVGLDVYQRDDGQWDWRFYARNGEQQCESMQGYTSRAHAYRGFVDTVNDILKFLTDKIEHELGLVEDLEVSESEVADLSDIMGDGDDG